jgi:hypothetical protein
MDLQNAPSYLLTDAVSNNSCGESAAPQDSSHHCVISQMSGSFVTEFVHLYRYNGNIGQRVTFVKIADDK